MHTNLALVSALSLALAGTALGGSIKQVSLGRGGADSDGGADTTAISANGRFVVFASAAENLVAEDGNDKSDVFVHDLKKGKTTLISHDPIGLDGNNQSSHAVVSKNGRFIAFNSDASNLVANDTKGFVDVFVHDRKTGTTERVSLDSAGNEVDGNSIFASISANGRFVAFESSAPNLVADDTNGKVDVFVRDRLTGTTTRVSVASGGVQIVKGGFDCAISGNGRFVAFVSGDAEIVPNDENSANDVFVHDRETGDTSLVTVNALGATGDESSRSPSLSFDGRFIAFGSGSTDLVPGGAGNDDEDVFVRDMVEGTTECVSVSSGGILGDQDSALPDISANGRFVVFQSLAQTLVTGDTLGVRDVFLHDRKKHVTTRVSKGRNGAEASASSTVPQVSKNGKVVTFSSDANNLVVGDGNAFRDAFVFRRGK